jgi:hypothetical protein
VAVEIFTYKGQDVANEVIAKFGDIGMVQITTTMLLTWINNGQRKMTGEIPFIEGSASTAEIAGQAAYDFSALFAANRIQDVQSVLLEGKPLNILPWAQFQPLAQANVLQSGVISGQQSSAAFWGSVLTIYPTPTNTVANGITAYFHQYPADLTSLANQLTVPDRFYNGLVEYVLAQAFILNENLPTAAQLLSNHEASMQRQMGNGQNTPTDFYTGVTMDPFDNDAVY